MHAVYPTDGHGVANDQHRGVIRRYIYIYIYIYAINRALCHRIRGEWKSSEFLFPRANPALKISASRNTSSDISRNGAHRFCEIAGYAVEWTKDVEKTTRNAKIYSYRRAFHQNTAQLFYQVCMQQLGILDSNRVLLPAIYVGSDRVLTIRSHHVEDVWTKFASLRWSSQQRLA